MQVEITDLHHTYPGGIHALQGITLTIQAAEQVAVVGENGAGKTTLVKHLNGLLRPSSGGIRIGGWDTQEHAIAELATRVGYVFQNPDDQLFSRTVEDEIAFGPKNLGFPARRIARQVERAIELTELGSSRRANPYDLSPTWRKMVALASILALDTAVLILDEPTTGQDYRTVERISRILRVLSQEGKTVIAISHDMDFCADNFDRLIALRHGKVVLDQPMAEAVTRVDVLASTLVAPPQISRLASALDLDRSVLSVDEFVRKLQARRQLDAPPADPQVH